MTMNSIELSVPTEATPQTSGATESGRVAADSNRPDRSYPLTPLQQGLIYHGLREPSAGLYIQQLQVDLHQPVDAAVLQRAWQRVLAWCEVLGTQLDLHDSGGFSQRFRPDLRLPWTEQDWSTLADEQQKIRWQEFLSNDRRRGFDFKRAPLMRLALFRLADCQYRFLWTFHHLLLDGRSHLVVIREAWNCYDALAAGRGYRFPEVAGFGRFTQWLARRDHSVSRPFWTNYLAGFQAPVQLALATPDDCPATVGSGRSSLTLSLSRGQTGRLRAFAARHQLTLNTLVMASWAVLLGRYSGTEDVVVGATRACRHGSIAGSETLLGLLINTVPLRIQSSDGVSLLTWLKTIRSDWLAMRPHEQTPLTAIQEWTGFGTERPLFDSLLVYEDSDYRERLRAAGGPWGRRDVELHERGNYPLVAAARGGSRLQLQLVFSRRRLVDATAQAMLAQWRRLLVDLESYSDRAVVDLPVLTPVERVTVLERWNDTDKTYPQDLCLHQLFEAQVQRTPDRAAVLCEPQGLSYRELNRRANRLAHHLLNTGVQPEDRVALCLERSPELIVAVLAVLKAGAAYIPLDAGQPQARLLEMLDGARVSLLLTQTGVGDPFAAGTLPVICVDAARAAIGRCPDSNPDSGVTPANLAYGIYTSGSTGKPKLIGVEHRSAVNFLQYTTQVIFRPSDLAVVPFADAITFDPSVYRLFTVLAVGGSLVLLQTLFDLPESRWSGQVTSLGGAPSVLSTLFADYEPPPSLRMVSFGAEMPSDALLQKLLRWPHIERLFNFYGPTEATISCTGTLLVDRRPSDSPGQPPGRADDVPSGIRASLIGRPFWNIRVYLLDHRLRPVPVGVTGEIGVAGAGVSRGYLNQPDLTAEKFVADPFSTDPTARLYRTGDLGRLLPDGRIEFVGRIDHQVKQNGMRIELGEIESQLGRHPDVRNCVVLQREDQPGEKRLVAYVELTANASRQEMPLRNWLKQKLPSYMVPGSIVLMDPLPLTANGKLDRRALPPPPRASAGRAGIPLGPRNPMELHLVKIWEDVLETGPIGVRDDFFALGGHSLLAVTLLDQVEKHFGKRLPLDSLWLDSATIEQLAGVLAQDIVGIDWPELVEIKKGGEKPPLFFVHTTGGNLFHYYPLADALAADQPVYGLQARGVYGNRQARDNIPDIAADAIAAMRRRQPRGPYRIGGYSSGGTVAYEMAQQLKQQGEQVACLALLDTYGPGSRWKKRRLKSWADMLAPGKLRHTQEKVYHRLLHPLGLRGLRQLGNIGESHRWAHWSYKPRRYDARIDLFVAADSAQAAADPTLGWQRMAPAELVRHALAADSHGLIVKPPVVMELADKLQQLLDRC